MSKTILVPPGIGDVFWVLQTMQEPAKFKICKSNAYRAWQLLDLVPHLVDGYSESESVKFTYDNARITHANTHLEQGNRLEDFTGWVDWDMPLQTGQYKKHAGKLLRKPRGKNIVGVYTSTLKHTWVRRGQAWGLNEWVHLIGWLNSKGLEVALFGASYDMDTAEALEGAGVEFVNCVGDQHLGVTVEAMKKCAGFIGFPSGLPVIAHHLRLPTIMFFPHDRRHYSMLNTFNRPGSIEDGTWKGCTFPKSGAGAIIEWIENSEVWAEIL